jgi:hypothetical protein
MAEQRQIPEVERLDSRDLPSAPGVPYLAPPIHLGAAHTIPAPELVVLTPTTPAAASQSQVTPDLTPIAAGENDHPLAAISQQSTDVVFSSLAEPGDSASTEWTQSQALPVDPSTNGVTAPEPQAGEAADAIAATPGSPSRQETPTIAGVERYAWRSVNRHRLDDRSDAVQQICLEWLVLTATIATTYDDVRRIVARVIDRDYRRRAKQERTLELLDVAVRADATGDSFRDMQLDRDLGVKDLTDREWEIVGLRRQGYTFAEIGLQVGMRKQRARELFEFAVSCLRRRYRDYLGPKTARLL